MAQLSRTTGTYTAHTLATAANVESDVNALFTGHNNHDSGTSKWTLVSTLNASNCPLVADNSTGTNDIAEFKDNGVTSLTVADGGIVTFAPGGTTKAVVNSSGLTLSNSATIAMGVAKITGLAAATANGDAVRFEQISGLRILQVLTANNSTVKTTTSSTPQTTNLTLSATLTSSGNKFIIFASGSLGAAVTSSIATAYIYRDTTNLSGNGFAEYLAAAASSSDAPAAGFIVDAPGDTSAHTYSVKLASSNNVATVSWGADTTTQLIIVEIG